MAIDMFKPEPMNLSQVQPQLQSDRRYWPHIKGFIGAMDGTNVLAMVSRRDQLRYWNRKNKCIKHSGYMQYIHVVYINMCWCAWFCT